MISNSVFHIPLQYSTSELSENTDSPVTGRTILLHQQSGNATEI